MKTIFTPLKHPKTILIVIIFFTLFLVFSLIAPAQTALGNRNNDEDFEPNTGHAAGYDGGDGNSGGGGGGSSNPAPTSALTGDYSGVTGHHQTAQQAQQAADEMARNTTDATGIEYVGSVSRNASGGYDSGVRQSQQGGGGGNNGGSTQTHNGNVSLFPNKTTVFINEPVRLTWNIFYPSYTTIAHCGTAGGFGDWPNPDLYTQNWVNAGYQLDSTLIQSTGTYLGFSSPGSREFQTENVGHYVFNYRCAFRTNNRGGEGNLFDNSPLASVSIDVLPAPVTATPTATISATNCTIASGASTCYANLTWNIENATNPNVRNTTRLMTLSIATTGVSVPRALIYGQNTIVARDSTTVLATTFANATCASGSVWIGTKCGPKTDLNPVSPTITPQCTTTDSPCPTSTVSFTIYNAGAPISAGTNVPYRIEYKENGSNVWQTAVNGNWSGGLAYPGTTPPINNTFSLDLPYGNHKVRVVVNLSPSNNPSIGEVNFSNNISNELGLSKSPDPVQLEFRADNDVIRYNTPATLKYQIVAPYDVSCTITGPVEGSRIINHTAGDNSVYPITSLKLTNQQKFTITCPDTAVNGFTAPGVRKDVIMEVVPVVWEV